MSENRTTAAPGWYPDPWDPSSCRYWDGATWTGYVNRPYPTSAASVPVPGPEGTPWSKGTKRLVIACVTIVILALTATVGFEGAAATRVQNESASSARAVLVQFLNMAVKGDRQWRDVASPAMLARDRSGIGAPFGGDPTTARALALSVHYSITELNFDNGTNWTQRPGASEADSASAVVALRYQFTVLGKTYSSTTAQTVWLTRPFYYGSPSPERYKPGHTATAVGPWRVTANAISVSEDLHSQQHHLAKQTTTLDPDRRDADADVCSEVESVLADISDSARKTGELTSSCLYGDGHVALDKSIDTKAVAATFPVVLDGDFDNTSVPPEITQLDASSSSNDFAPLKEYVIGDGAQRYVLTLAAASPVDGHPRYRIIALQQAQKDPKK